MKVYFIPAFLLLAACGDEPPVGHTYGPCAMGQQISFTSSSDVSINVGGSAMETKWKRGSENQIVIFPIGVMDGDEKMFPAGVINEDGDLDFSGMIGVTGVPATVCKKIS